MPVRQYVAKRSEFEFSFLVKSLLLCIRFMFNQKKQKRLAI